MRHLYVNSLTNTIENIIEVIPQDTVDNPKYIYTPASGFFIVPDVDCQFDIGGEYSA